MLLEHWCTGQNIISFIYYTGDMEIEKAWLSVRHVVTMKCQWREEICWQNTSISPLFPFPPRLQGTTPGSEASFSDFCDFVCLFGRKRIFSQESTWCVCITTFSASLLLSIISPIRPISTWNKTGQYSLFCQNKLWTCLFLFIIFLQPGPPKVGSPWKVEVLAFSCWPLHHQYHPCLSPEFWMAKLCWELWINSERKYFKFDKKELSF